MKQIIYLGSEKAREYDGVNPPPIIGDYNSYQLAINEYDKHISTLQVFNVIEEHNWREGEIMSEGVDYEVREAVITFLGWIVRTDETDEEWGKYFSSEAVIVPIQKHSSNL